MKKIPLHSLVIMVGPSGSGKSTLASKKFKPYEILAIDNIRESFVGDFTRRDVTDVAWDTLYKLAELKLSIGERVVIDGTHLRKHDRMKSASLGKKLGVPVFYVIVNRPLDDKLETEGWRSRYPNLVKTHDAMFVENERDIIWGDGIAEVIDTRIGDFEVINKLDREHFLDDIKSRGFSGVTVVGDVHGQYGSFSEAIDWGRRRNHFLVFLGDLIDYGPKNLETVDLAYHHIVRGSAVNVIGNHELKISRWLNQPSANFKLSEGNRVTTAQFEKLSSDDKTKWKTKFATLMNLGAYHWVLGNFIMAHGAVSDNLSKIYDTQLRGKLGKFVMFGEHPPSNDTFEQSHSTAPDKLYNWCNFIPKGKTAIVGHDIRSVTAPVKVTSKQGGETIFLDTGSGKGGVLTCADIPFSEMKVTNFYRC